MLKGLLKDAKVQLLKGYRQGNIFVSSALSGITSLEEIFIFFSLHLIFSVTCLLSQQRISCQLFSVCHLLSKLTADSRHQALY